MKEILKNLVLSLLFGWLLYCLLYTLFNDWRPKYSDCGIVKSKSTEQIIHRHSSETDLYLNVQFENSGFKSVLVTRETYHQKEVGNSVCFTLEKETSNYDKIVKAIGALTFIVLAGVLIVWFFLWLFDEL